MVVSANSYSIELDLLRNARDYSNCVNGTRCIDGFVAVASPKLKAETHRQLNSAADNERQGLRFFG